MSQSLEKVHLSQIYPCSKISLSSELYYVCELGKYLSEYGKCLSIDGVILDNILRKSNFWNYLRVAINNGWVVDAGLDTFDIEITIQNPIELIGVKNVRVVEREVFYDKADADRRRDDPVYNWLTPIDIQVFFKSKTNDVWNWTLSGGNCNEELVNSKSLNSLLPSQSWLTLTAYVAIHRYITSYPTKFAIEFSNAIVANKQLSVSDILLLEHNTDALNGWFFVSMNTTPAVELQCGYEAWWYQGREQGLLAKEYTAKEKYMYFRSLGFKIGDVVLIYERKVSQQANYVKSIENMHFAIIEGVNSEGVALSVVHTKKTRHGFDKWFANLTMAVKEMYMGNDSYKQYNATLKNFSWRELGIEYYMFSEQFFITPLQNEDTVVLDVTDNVSRSDTFVLPEVDVIYWILKDYDVNFNEEHYIEVNYGGKKPLYTRYMEGESLDEYRYVPAV